MSQVRKLLETPTLKFQSGGKFWKNNVLVGEGEDVYKQLANYLAGTKFDEVRDYANDFLQQYSTGKEFHTSGNYSNYVPTGRTEDWAKEGTSTGKFWGASFNTDKSRYYKFNQLLNRFNYVAPEKKEEKTPDPKKDFDISEIILNYNDDPKKKGHRIWSTGHADNQRAIQRVTDAIAGLKDPDNSNYNFSDSLKAAYAIAANSGMTPEEYAAAVWERLQDNKWTGYKNPENDNDLDWLKAFGIGVAPYNGNVSIRSNAGDNNSDNDARTSGNNKNSNKEDDMSTENNGSSVENNPEIIVVPEEQKVEYINIPGTNVAYSSPDEAGWSNYIIHIKPGNYQYNTNNNIATGRTGEQPRAERRNMEDISFVAKTIGNNPLVYNGVNYPIVQEKDTSNYYALMNNGRLQLDQDFVTRWLQNQLTEVDNKTMSKWSGQKPKTIDDNGNDLGWLVKLWNTLTGPNAQVDISSQARKDRKAVYYPKETREEFKARRAKETEERRIAAGGKRQKDGGTINSKKVAALVAKNGGKVRKAQNPNGTVFGKHGPIGFSPEEEFDYFAPYTAQQEDPVYGKNGVLSIASQQTGNPNAGNLNTIKREPLDKSSLPKLKDITVPPRTDVGGDPVDPMPFWRDFSGNILDAGRFVSSAYFSDKIRKNRIKTAYEAIKKPTTALLHGYSTVTPVEDAQIAQISSLIGNVKHATTSNNAVTEALSQYDWANLLPQLNQVWRYKSQRADAINRENVGIANQQSQMDANAWNDFMNQYRGARMIEGQANEDHMRNIAESLQNVLLQERAKLSQSIDKFADFDLRQKIQNNTNLSESQLNTLYVDSGARAAYNADPDKNNYVDIADWIDSSPKGAQFKTSLRKQIDEINEGLQIANRDAYIKTKVPYWHQKLYRKSGGKISVKSKNRYKNEPWEDIWINSNKAAHSAAAKLSDNIIKTFLKTLK